MKSNKDNTNTKGETMTMLSELRRDKRELLTDMKEAGIKRVCCMNRLDDQTWTCNRKLAEINAAIDKEKATKVAN